MSNARTLTVLAGAAAIAEDDSQWIEVIPACEKARNGRWFFTITADDLATYAESIRANAGLIPVDYDHEGADGGSTVAAGWFTGDTEIVAKDAEAPSGETQDHDSLWAKVKWTPQAAQEIRDGRYKRLSPEFTFADREEKTGLMTKAKEILAATLTNRPFFKEMAPVGAKDDIVWDADGGFTRLQELVSSALNPGDTYRYWVMDVKPGAALIRESGSAQTFVAAFEITDRGAEVAPASEWVEAKQEWVQATEAALESAGIKPPTRKEDNMDLTAYAAALGLPEDADEATILAAIKEAREAAAKKTTRRNPRGGQTMAELSAFAEALGLDPSADESTVLAAVRKAAEDSDRVSTLEDEHDDLTATAREKQRLEGRIKAIEAERRAEKIQRILVDAVRDGQVIPAEKQVLAKNFAENPDGLLELINARPKRGWSAAGSGDGSEDSGDVRAAKSRFESDEADGVDEDSVRLHVRAEQWLAERGKRPGTYTDLEYAQACDAVELERVH